MNENDENAPATRMTRAKASIAVGPTDAAKKPALQTKRATGTNGTQRRAALEDVSNNGNKAGAVAAKDGKKKPLVAPKTSSTAKPGTNGGVQKLNRTISSRAGAKKPTPVTSNKRPKDVVAKEEVQPEEPPRKKKLGPVKEEVKDEPIEKGKIEVPADPQDIVQDLDSEDLDDPLMAAEYVVEIFDYLQELELLTLPNPQYIEHQPDLEWKMRGILVDWLIEVHTRFRLLPETLFLAVNIIDRFLSAEVVALDRLQLVGVTAMFIASKYEEVLSPHVANFSHVADETFSDKEILDAERHVLATLQYNMSYPNPMNFLRRISKADNYDIQTRTLGKYLMEITTPQSQIAAAAMYLARLILDRGAWDATIAHYAGYTEKEIDPVFRLMVDYLHRPVSHEAFFKKYASKKFLKASILTRQWAKKYHHLYIDSSLSEPYTYIKDSEQ
ncbi:G2/mitotic-specific cyclin-B [Penicillium chermesinum]|uniref:G2/mitotic-specific cyclin-B n=1 Tax=Penicillium chermesinum TaxID=63820 RepID=A0A9W9TC61_9EURO|nr:G2/mitotic-specific cyclin-B [Penicillium chermesinum]KAJ5217323.1 G2/mitotic-specific cyclin-B [Penicillium chermesinum]